MLVTSAVKNDFWQKRIFELKKEELDLNLYRDKFFPKKIIETVHSHCQNETIIVTDFGQHQRWVAQNYKFENARTLLTSGGLGTMGYGMGAAIGGCLASGKQTILFTGDGSFGMNLNELATAVSLNLPLIIIIMNNGVLGMVKQWQTIYYNKRYSNTVLKRKTNFTALAKAFGANGYFCTNLKRLEKTLQKSFNCGPVVIECKINSDEKVLPMIPSGASDKDIIVK